MVVNSHSTTTSTTTMWFTLAVTTTTCHGHKSISIDCVGMDHDAATTPPSSLYRLGVTSPGCDLTVHGQCVADIEQKSTSSFSSQVGKENMASILAKGLGIEV